MSVQLKPPSSDLKPNESILFKGHKLTSGIDVRNME